MAPAQPLKPPRQARSRATLDRFLKAAVELLGERRFEDASVAEIVRRASSSVGAFYGRFADKGALLTYLNHHMFEAGRSQWSELLAAERWRGRGSAEIVQAVVRHLVARRRAHRGLLRALALHARSHPKPAFLEAATALNRHVLGLVQALLLERAREIAHPRPAQAVAFGLLMVDAATREAILFEETATLAEGRSDAELARELTAAWLAYLGVPQARRPR